jgi:GDPmannose 4,6-dehydratase
MWLMLQQDMPDDFVVATGRTHTVRSLCEIAFGAADMNWEDHVIVDERYFRPAEVDLLVGDAAKARAVLGWQPEVTFEQMIVDMVAADIDLVASQPRAMWPLNVRYT